MTESRLIKAAAACVFLAGVVHQGWAQTSAWNISEKDKSSYTRDGGNYLPAAELKQRPGVPKGEIKAYRLAKSTVYAGTPHDYWIYKPAQYRPGISACLLVVLDGEAYLKVGIPTLLDNLIQDKQVPVIIGLFVNPGPNGPGYPLYGGTDNRSIEYDSVNAEYANFLSKDLLPKVKALYTLSEKPDCHAVMGGSSGGSAAFGVAWHRPDLFSKVISSVGSFVNIRGADAYPSMVRRAQRKPIRVFLQAGANDLDTIFGSWPLANQQMAAALAYREYDYRFEYGEGGHNGRHFEALAADAMRWIWRDSPR